MRTIHLANTDFEFELAKPQPLLIEQVWARYPHCLQLQFLPILYAEPQDAIAVTAPPHQGFIDYLLSLGLWKQEDLPLFVPLQTLHPLSYDQCLSWGFSQRVKKWAHMRQVAYHMPDWQVVQEVNSKVFSFKQLPSLPGSALIRNLQDLEAWLQAGQGKRVLKTCFGLSGKGNRLIDETTSIKDIQVFCEKEWKLQRPLIAEPWLDRFFDFSTQWALDPQGDIQCIGSTVFETDSHGTYQGTYAGPEFLLFQCHHSFLKEHKKMIYPVLKKITQMGFFGSLGVDAFLYRNSRQEINLYPMVEINGRQTFSLAALRFQRRWFPEKVIRLSFIKVTNRITSLLPTQLKLDKSEIYFNKALILSFPNVDGNILIPVESCNFGCAKASGFNDQR